MAAEIIDLVNFAEDKVAISLLKATVVLFTSSFNGIIYPCSFMAHGGTVYFSFLAFELGHVSCFDQ